ncbi:hypothetical protein GCM10010251_14810 [Streptomyces aurantiogriseus]|uniref:Uncharacterized protein n=1 Tax=Streptomyces aurantiogriseus TaxID=66870 RepID=A0A918C2B6_9ACTN|nr:hypothetical protein GCM10010251_14810 [Streptomyces aurantiogriseus]
MGEMTARAGARVGGQGAVAAVGRGAGWTGRVSCRAIRGAGEPSRPGAVGMEEERALSTVVPPLRGLWARL